MRAMRTLLSQEGPASRVSRMSDETVIDQIAHLLVSGRLHVHAQPWCGLPGSSGQSASTASSSAAASAAASAKDAEKLAPFPLSERGQREPAASVAPKPAEQSVICRLFERQIHMRAWPLPPRRRPLRGADQLCFDRGQNHLHLAIAGWVRQTHSLVHRRHVDFHRHWDQHQLQCQDL